MKSLENGTESKSIGKLQVHCTMIYFRLSKTTSKQKEKIASEVFRLFGHKIFYEVIMIRVDSQSLRHTHTHNTHRARTREGAAKQRVLLLNAMLQTQLQIKMSK